MSSAENGKRRPVWLTDGQVRALDDAKFDMHPANPALAVIFSICDQFDAALADPAEAIATFLLDRDYGQPDFSQASPLMQTEYLSLAAIVLGALGVPPERESPTRETP